MLERAHITEDELYAYVLGEGDAASRASIRKHLALCESCAREAAGTQTALSVLAFGLPEETPSASVERRVMDEISGGRKPASVAALPAREAARQRSDWRWAFSFGLAAAVILLIVSIREISVNQRLQQQIRALQATNTTLAGAQAAMRNTAAQEQQTAAQAANASALLSALTAPDTAKFVLTRANAAPEPQVRAFYRRSTGQVLMTASSLPPLPAGKTYELWLLGGAAPAPAGLFHPDSSGSVALVSTSLPKGLPVKGFGVTVENAAGASAPTPPILLASK